MKAIQRALACLLVIAGLANSARSQSPTLGTVWSYTLINGSSLLDGCPICDRLSLPIPLRGTFQLRFIEQGPLFSTYALENISLIATGNGSLYHLVGTGVVQIGGEVLNQQMITLQLLVDDGVSNSWCYFTNSDTIVQRRWPMLQMAMDQTNGTVLRQFQLALNTAPFREIWFSTSQPFMAGLWNAPTNSIGAGDLVCGLGRVVKRNADFLAALGVPFDGTDLGLKDLDVLPGGEIAFSLQQTALSSTLGILHPGDVLSSRGRILRTNLSLVSSFVPAAPLPSDLGLAACKIVSGGAIWFSTQTNFFSKTLGRLMQPGDLLSDGGLLVRSNAQLLAQFNPANPTNDYGLNAIYVWPSGEIWFSTGKGFFDVNSNYFDGGDLLSDAGYLVYSNAELLAALLPSNAPASLGLDALYVVTDVLPAAPAPQLAMPQWTNNPPLSLVLAVQASGRVFQLEHALNVDGPFLPLTPISTETQWIDPGVLSDQVRSFYRVRQW